jgi:hypothetical protein
MIGPLLAMALVVASGGTPASTAAPAANPDWQTTATSLVFAPAHVALPRRAAIVSLTQTGEGTHRGEHIDNVAQFESPDRQIFATLFVFTPALPDPRLVAIGIDNAVHIQSGAGLEAGPPRLVSAAGVPGAAILRSYRHFRGTLASAAAVIRSGRWIVAVRVSGPDARRDEVEATATAFLDGISFEGAARPQPSSSADTAECEAEGHQRDARLLPPTSMQNLLLMTVMVDLPDLAEHSDSPRRPPRPASPPVSVLCISSRLHIGNMTVPVVRESGPQGNGGAVYAILDDAGGLFEVSAFTSPFADSRSFQLYQRMIGRTEILGNFDRLPTDAQLAEILGDPNHRARHIIAAVSIDVDGHRNVEISADAMPHR